VFGGLWMARVGPRTVGLTAAVLYGLGSSWPACRPTSCGCSTSPTACWPGSGSASATSSQWPHW
jgi:hypothetical protein